MADSDGKGKTDGDKTPDDQKKQATTYSQEQLDKAVADALEKAKLSGDNDILKRNNDLSSKLEKATSTIEELTSSIAELEKMKAEHETLVNSLKEDTKGKKSLDPEKFMQEVTSKLEASSRSSLEELERKLEKTQSELNGYRITDLRNRLIEKNGGSKAMIIELVKGDNEAEIVSSIAEAKRLFSIYGGGKSKGDADNTTDDTSGNQNKGNEDKNNLRDLPGSASGGADQTLESDELTKLANMPFDEYVKNRGSRKNLVDGLFRQASGG